MRCIACDNIIDNFFIKLTGQDELCEDCYVAVNKAVNPLLEAVEPEIILDIDSVENEI